MTLCAKVLLLDDKTIRWKKSYDLKQFVALLIFVVLSMVNETVKDEFQLGTKDLETVSIFILSIYTPWTFSTLDHITMYFIRILCTISHKQCVIKKLKEKYWNSVLLWTPFNNIKCNLILLGTNMFAPSISIFLFLTLVTSDIEYM